MRQAGSAESVHVAVAGAGGADSPEVVDKTVEDLLDRELDKEGASGNQKKRAANKEGEEEPKAKASPAPKKPRSDAVNAEFEKVALKELKKAEKEEKKKAADAKAKASPEPPQKRLKGKRGDESGSAVGLAAAFAKKK